MSPRNIGNVLENTVMEVANSAGATERVREWGICREYTLWRELVSCILGSRTVFELSRSAALWLHQNQLLGGLMKESSRPSLRKRIASELRRPIYLPPKNNGAKRSYQYPNSKAYQIYRTAEDIYGKKKSLKSLLWESLDEYDARVRLLRVACGIGPKQSSLFLRNTCYTDNLAILDSHILNYMRKLRLLSSPVASVSSLRSYEKLERRLSRYADQLNIKMSRLDTAIWIVMRVYKREFHA